MQEGGPDIDAWADEPVERFEETLWGWTREAREERSNILGSLDQKDLPLFSLLALISAGAGVRSRGEITLVAIGHIVYWFLGFSGVAGMYSIAAGFLFQKKRYAYAALPTFLDVYTTFQKIRKSDNDLKDALLNLETMIRVIMFIVGFTLAHFKIV